MIPLKEIGECLVIDGNDEYFFRPSLIAMSSIGEPGEIVATFHLLHSGIAKTSKTLMMVFISQTRRFIVNLNVTYDFR